MGRAIRRRCVLTIAIAEIFLFIHCTRLTLRCTSFQPLVSVRQRRGRDSRSSRRRITLRDESNGDVPPVVEDPNEFDILSDLTRRHILSSVSAISLASSLLDAQTKQVWAAVPDVSTSQIPFTADNIPYSSVRSYKAITLRPNGLQVLLVSDKNAPSVQCALTVPAGQFCDPNNLPGCAHLLEHMILSYNSRSSFRPSRDFEDWLGDHDGASNAFTANQKTCFHFTCPKTFVVEALERFASLFLQQNVENVCRNVDILRREIRRVDSELSFDNVNTQIQYVCKAFVNLEHPYSRFSQGNLNSLESVPSKLGLDVGEYLIQFYKRFYTASQTVLVVVGSQDISTLQRLVAPFSTAMSKSKKRDSARSYFPGQFLQGNRPKRVILYRKSDESIADSTEKMIFQWVLSQDYRDMMRGNKKAVTAPQIAFVLSQILGRRGPGSLFAFLDRRGWIPTGSVYTPRISLPVDVSGFQILKVELTLTLEGFLNRSKIVMALYDIIGAARFDGSFVIARELMAQYSAIAKLFAYTLSPRPPDAVELSFDAQLYGLATMETGRWYRFPVADDLSGLGLNNLRRAVSSVLSMMNKPENSVIIVTAGEKAIAMTNKAFLADSLPPLVSPRWLREDISGARICYEDMTQLKSRFEQTVLAKIINADELMPPIFNPLVPTVVRQSRRRNDSGDHSNLVLLGANSKTFAGWTLIDLTSVQQGLLLPRGPPEPTCRCSFVLQLLSSRPARANVRQAARAELWKLSFERSIADLAEQGIPGGLAYDISFNKFGLRLAFLGVGQTLPSYARRLVRRLVQHQVLLFNGPSLLPISVTSEALNAISKARDLSPNRQRIIASTTRLTTASDAASEGLALLRSCHGGVCVAQGDLLPAESIQLLADLHGILQGSLSDMSTSAVRPALSDILYKPTWKPRYASNCCIPGISLMSDACGRLPR